MIRYLDYLAVYGTLRKDKNGFSPLDKIGCEYTQQVQVRGELYDLGPFPGYVYDSNIRPKSHILCDIFKLPEDLKQRIEVLQAIDKVENYLYNRIQMFNWVLNDYFYIYEARDWVVEDEQRISLLNPIDWLEYQRNRDNHD